MKKYLFFLFTFVFFLFPQTASAKDYYFPDVTIEYRIQSDGTIHVVELRTFEFDGSFTWAEQYIPLKGQRKGYGGSSYTYNAQISDFRVFLDGKQLEASTKETDDTFYAKWFYKARDERKTFELRYILSQVITGYADVNEFFWQPIGTDWSKPTKSALVRVFLPAGAGDSEVFVFGHGPLSGQSTIISPQHVEFTAENLAPGEYLEIRVLFPKELAAASYFSENHTLSSIIIEEEQIVKRTIAAAKKAQYSQGIKKGTIFVYIFIAIAGTLSWPLFYLHYWSKYGQNYHTPTAKYIKEPPSALPPAMVEALLRQETLGDRVSTKAFVATIFDLARRGFFEVRDDTTIKSGFLKHKRTYKTYLTSKVNKEMLMDTNQLRPFEQKLVMYVFGGFPDQGEELTFKHIKDSIKHHPEEFKGWFKNWKEIVENDLHELSVMEDQGNNIAKRFWIFTFLLTLFASPTIVWGMFLIPKLKRRAYPWEYEAKQWEGMKRFLDDFGKFKKLPPEAYKLWDVYLIFGILFGSAKKIIKQLPVILENSKAVQPTWFVARDLSRLSPQKAMGLDSISHFANVINSTANSLAKASLSAAHYSSGGGGGFSGGFGGGGFGGGGGGGGGAG